MLENHERLDKFNAFAAQLERCLEACKQSDIEILEQITPLDELETKIGREVEILHLQLSSIEEALKADAPNFDSLNQQYQQQLKEELERFRSGYQELLKSKASIFVEGECKELTSEQKKISEANFDRLIDIEGQEYRRFAFNNETDLVQLQQRIQKAIDAKSRQASALIQAKIPLSETLHYKQQIFGKELLAIKQQAASYQQSIENSLVHACYEGALNKVKSLTEAQTGSRSAYLKQQISEGRNSLHVACLLGHVEIAKYLLENGIRIEAKDALGYSLIHYALMKPTSNTVVILNLLKRFKIDCFALGPYRRTALHTAALFNNLEGAEWLIQKGLPVNTKEEGAAERTPLHNAAYKGDVEMVALLLKNHADPSLTNANQETCLGEAILSAQFGVITELFNRGIWLTKSEFTHLLENVGKYPYLADVVQYPLQRAITKVQLALGSTIDVPSNPADISASMWHNREQESTHQQSPSNTQEIRKAQEMAYH